MSTDTVTVDRARLESLILQNESLSETLDSATAALEGNNQRIEFLLEVFDKAQQVMNVLEQQSDQFEPIFEVRDDDPVMVAAIVHAIQDLSAVLTGSVQPGFWVDQKGTVH